MFDLNLNHQGSPGNIEPRSECQPKRHSSGRPEADWKWGSGGRMPPSKVQGSPCGLITQVATHEAYFHDVDQSIQHYFVEFDATKCKAIELHLRLQTDRT